VQSDDRDCLCFDVTLVVDSGHCNLIGIEGYYRVDNFSIVRTT